MDSFIHLDRILGEFLAFLDERVGRDLYVVVITADHGVPSMPERIHATQPGVPAERVEVRDFDRAVTAALLDTFGPAPGGRPWVRRDNQGYRVNRAALTATGATFDPPRGSSSLRQYCIKLHLPQRRH